MGLDSEGIQKFDAPLGSVNRRCADSSKANVELSWWPKVSLAEGIQNVLKN